MPKGGLFGYMPSRDHGFKSRPLLGQLTGTRRQFRADLDGEVREALMPSQFLQTVLNQLVGAVQVLPLAARRACRNVSSGPPSAR